MRFIISLFAVLSIQSIGYSQNNCITIDLEIEGKKVDVIKTAQLYIIGNEKDTISINVQNNIACIEKIPTSNNVDVVLKFDDQIFTSPAVPKSFLKVNKNSRWLFGIDKRPIDKKRYRQIKNWDDVNTVEFIEVESDAGNAERIVFKIKKDGAYIY